MNLTQRDIDVERGRQIERRVAPRFKLCNRRM
jgi:hypothetical protein